MTDDTRWWLFRCRSQRERKAHEYLTGLGYAVVAPMEIRYRKPSRHVRGSAKRISFAVAAMPSWLIVGTVKGGPSFARIMAEREKPESPMNWHAIHPVVCDSQAVMVPGEDVARLQSLEESGELVAPDHWKVMNRGWEYEVGGKVEIIDGPFRATIARVLEIRGGVARIEFELLGGAAKIEIASDALVKADG